MPSAVFFSVFNLFSAIARAFCASRIIAYFADKYLVSRLTFSRSIPRRTAFASMKTDVGEEDARLP